MKKSRPALDFLVKPSGYYNQHRPEMLGYVPTEAKSILEVGCGEGHFGAALKQRQRTKVWGIELDEKVAKTAERNLDRVIVGDVQTEISRLPSNRFDCVIFNDVLEHLVDPYQVLLETKRILTKDGVIVCSIPNIRFIRALKKILLDKQWRYEDNGIFDKTHMRFFTERSIREMLTKLGYRIINLEGINGINTWKFNLANLLTLGSLEDTRYLQFACVAKPKRR